VFEVAPLLEPISPEIQLFFGESTVIGSAKTQVSFREFQRGLSRKRS